MKKTLFALVGFVLLANLSIAGFAVAGQNWKIGHVRPSGSSIDTDIHWLTKEVSKNTSGQIKFDIYPSSKLGDYTIVQERCAFGEVEMFVGPFGTSIDRRLALPAIPYLVKDWASAKRVFAHDAVLMQKMGVYLEQQNIKLLGGWPVYFGGFLLTEKPISPEDPSVKKNLLVRVPPINSFRLTAKSLGYTPYPIAWVYARSGLESGMVKGVVGGGAEGYVGLASKAKYYLPIKDHFEHWLVYMNLDLWKELTETQKGVLETAVRKMEQRRFEVAETEEALGLKKLQERGVEIIPLGKDQIERISNHVRKDIWPRLEREYGEDFSELIK